MRLQATMESDAYMHIVIVAYLLQSSFCVMYYVIINDPYSLIRTVKVLFMRHSNPASKMQLPTLNNYVILYLGQDKVV